MGRIDANPDPQYSDQPQYEFEPPPQQDYSNQQDDDQLSQSSDDQQYQYATPQDGGINSTAANEQQYQQPPPPPVNPSLPPQQAPQPSTQAYPTQTPPTNFPQPQAYPQQPAAYIPPQQAPPQPQAYHPQQPAAYVPPQQAPPQPQAYPPQQPAAYPPQPQAYPPQQPAAAYPPKPQPVAFPPPSPQKPSYQAAPQQYPPGNYNYNQNGQQQAYQQQTVNYGGQMGYQTPPKTGSQQGIPIGSQYLPQNQGWSTDLFACLDDPENAIITACFPCITFGQIAEIVDNGQTSCATSGLLYGVIAAFIGIPCLLSCSYRTKIRSRYGLMESPAPDWVTHCFCEWCALCQEYRELKNRGMDPAIGWQANLAKNQVQMQQYPTMTPPMNQTMMG